MTDDLRRWTAILAESRQEEGKRVFGERFDLPDRGQTLTPVFAPQVVTTSKVEGTAWFGDYFHGSNGAAHGGTLPLLFDEVFGHIAVERGSRARTAYLHTDFRSVTPIGVDLQVRAWVERAEGRKLFLAADLRDGEVVCAEAEALFVLLRDGAP
ncbi:PaaI family thioesterase [Nocardioides luteus]|uniref:PaaI family thioesterase n=1 Tax=Nocardioides luteus TaxID=1844 RepID=UPI001E33771C|nr:PaaI family thioesterase [Nocardioides luteus]